MKSVHFCSITHRSNQMHYFYYLKPRVNHDIGVGAIEKNHGTTAAQHT
jgi:hypothetical protein